MHECTGQRFFHNGRMQDCREFPLSAVYEGETVYEVIRVVRGVPLFLEDHLERLYHTGKISGRQIPASREEITTAVERVIRENGVREGNLKIIFNFGKGTTAPVRFLVYRVEHLYPTPSQYAEGVPCILYHGERPRPEAKIIHQGLRLTIYQKLISTGRYEALLVNREGYLTEGSRSNLFLVREGTIFTAPAPMVLPGISRKYVLQLCRELGIPLEEQAVREEDLPQTEALFLTGTSINVLPVNRVEERSFDPKHPLVRKLMEAYGQIVERYISSKLEV